MSCFRTKPNTKHHANLSTRLETIQADLVRLSGFLTQLSGLTGEQLAAFDITDQLDSIHRCINRFEAHCMAIQITACEDEFTAPIDDESYGMVFPENNNWITIRREAKHANKLACQLTNSLGNIRASLGEVQKLGAIPEVIVQINQNTGNAVNGLASDCLLDHG